MPTVTYVNVIFDKVARRLFTVKVDYLVQVLVYVNQLANIAT